jgi:hypothetical protein
MSVCEAWQLSMIVCGSAYFRGYCDDSIKNQTGVGVEMVFQALVEKSGA